jgi:hypothetical protein
MDLREALVAGGEELYRQLLAATVWVRRPGEAGYHTVSRPDTGLRAVPAFVTEEEARAGWGAEAEPMAFVALAAAVARPVGAVVLDPLGSGVVLGRSELTFLANAEMPGAFSAWLREPGRLGRAPSAVVARLRRTHVHVITSRGGEGAEPQLFLLEKSQDGTLAVPCFAAPESLAQFAEVRRLPGDGTDRAIGLLPGEQVLRVAAAMGAYVLIDPESPWETQVEPTLL